MAALAEDVVRELGIEGLQDRGQHPFQRPFRALRFSEECTNGKAVMSGGIEDAVARALLGWYYGRMVERCTTT